VTALEDWAASAEAASGAVLVPTAALEAARRAASAESGQLSEPLALALQAAAQPPALPERLPLATRAVAGYCERTAVLAGYAIAERWLLDAAYAILLATFELTSYAMLLAVILAVPLGIAAAVWRGTWVDHVSRILAVVGVAMPVFWVGLLAIYFFFYRLRWLAAPQGRISPALAPPDHITGLYTIDALITGNWLVLGSAVESLIMPAAVLAFAAMAPLARMARSGMIEALDADYTRAARALGLPERSVVLRHALRNAMLPLLTMTAIVYGYLLGGVVLVENIFAWPGLGRYVFNAITSSDYPAVQGFILYATTVYVLLFLAVDVLYGVLDPRVRY
jgi:peptide/nickel transport system permease protein